jgi:hypothetical protein
MSSPTGFKVDTPFARFLNKRGLNNTNLGEFATLANRLARDSKHVAPNSPMLPGFAAFLNISLRQLKSFAEGPEMSEAFVRKIQGQLERGDFPRGPRTSKKKRMPQQSEEDDGETLAVVEVQGRREIQDDEPDDEPKTATAMASATPFHKLVVSKHHTLRGLARHLSIPINAMWRVSAGGMAPNHPVLEIIAPALDVPLEELAAMQQGKVLNAGWLKRAQRDIAKYQKKGRKPGTAVVKHAHHETNGKAPAVQYNRLGSKRTELQLRQSARAMVATLNISIMRGDTHMPPLPVGDLYLLLQDYLHEKGVKANVLVDPAFAHLFDPK